VFNISSVRAALLVAAALPILFTTSAATAGVVSTFDVDAEGWTTFQNGGASVQYFPSGGNPGGYIGATDNTSDWAYLQAPSKFLVPAGYNGTLSFDLRIFNSDPAGFPNVYSVRVGLQGAGLTLINESVFPTTDWLNYSFNLNETSGWRIFSDLSQNYSAAAPAPTQSQMQAVLQNITLLVIATDYSNGDLADNSAIDTTNLDNVQLSTAAQTPLPAALPLFATGLGLLGFTAHRRKRKQAA
jgi:hypothetical protein